MQFYLVILGCYHFVYLAAAVHAGALWGLLPGGCDVLLDWAPPFLLYPLPLVWVEEWGGPWRRIDAMLFTPSA